MGMIWENFELVNSMRWTKHNFEKKITIWQNVSIGIRYNNDNK